MTDPVPTLPPRFLERLAAVVPPEAYDSALASFAVDKPLCARLNPLKGSSQAALEALEALGFPLMPLPGIADAYLIEVPPARRREVTDAPVVRTGGVYLQNPASLLPVLALGPRGDERVLDLCAAPGGKTLHLRGLMALSGATGGELAAVEAVRDRFFRLRGQLETHGATDVRTFLKDGRSVGHAVPERFDKVLVDAPCSSEARFDARDPETFAHWSDNKIQAMAYKQRGLLRAAIDAARVGGTIVYSTCSLAPEENEEVVRAVLAELPETGLVTTTPHGIAADALPTHTAGIGAAGADMLRVVPGSVWDAFFLVRLEKHGATGGPPREAREARGAREAGELRGSKKTTASRKGRR